MGDTVAALSHKADVPGRVKESVSEKTSAVGQKLGSARSAITGSAGDATGATREGSRRAAGTLRENPLGLAIGAAAVGFVVGSLLPSTRVEEERIGPVATQVRGQIEEVASDAVDHGKQVVQNAAEAARSAAQESGQEHARELGDSAQQTVRDEG
jgi:ElaB/YqjD/DUF883 family membrane-anchored ribosome-binding protein